MIRDSVTGSVYGILDGDKSSEMLLAKLKALLSVEFGGLTHLL